MTTSASIPRPVLPSLLPADYRDPIELFQDYFARAQESEPKDPHGMGGANQVALATATADGRPSVRIVLLKGADARGLIFYTNYDSRKGRELRQNPRAALCFYWPSLAAQVRVEGAVEKVPAAESDAYFASRQRQSQLAAWASTQSAILSHRDELDRRYAEVEARFAGAAVPRPAGWGGYLVRPDRMEFWAGSLYRMHDRLLYVRDEQVPHGWRLERLFP